MLSKYFVYIHVKQSDGEPFYVGKGVANRATSTHGRNKHWHNIVKKHGYEVIYIYDNLSPEQASELERLWVS